MDRRLPEADRVRAEIREHLRFALVCVFGITNVGAVRT